MTKGQAAQLTENRRPVLTVQQRGPTAPEFTGRKRDPAHLAAALIAAPVTASHGQWVVSLTALLKRLKPTERIILDLIGERWRERQPPDAASVVVTFVDFIAAGARPGDINPAIDFLESAQLAFRAGPVKRPRAGRPAMSYRPGLLTFQ